MVPLRSHLDRFADCPAMIPVLRHLICLAVFAFLFPAAELAAIDPMTARWLAAQTGTTTWQAEVRQTRRLKSLTQPLTAEGRVWFSAPNLFRWELGTPPQTIAVRQPTEMWVAYPRLKRAERYALDGPGGGPWKETLALLEAGFPRSEAELTNRFSIVSELTEGDLHKLVMEPRAASARRMMPRLAVTFATNDFSLRTTELAFADGSTLVNEFTNAVVNPALSPSLFSTPSGDYKVSEPGAHRP
jgi:outer membrane lipoprotein-sorting protein